MRCSAKRCRRFMAWPKISACDREDFHAFVILLACLWPNSAIYGCHEARSHTATALAATRYRDAGSDNASAVCRGRGFVHVITHGPIGHRPRKPRRNHPRGFFLVCHCVRQRVQTLQWLPYGLWFLDRNVKPESGTETARSTVHPCPRARRLCRDVRHLPGEPRGKVCGWYRYTDDDPWRIETLHQLGVRNRTFRRSNASRSASRSASSTRKTDT